GWSSWSWQIPSAETAHYRRNQPMLNCGDEPALDDARHRGMAAAAGNRSKRAALHRRLDLAVLRRPRITTRRAETPSAGNARRRFQRHWPDRYRGRRVDRGGARPQVPAMAGRTPPRRAARIARA